MVRLKKRLGQHLLTDTHILEKIVELGNLDFSQKTIIEVGPGKGDLTRAILKKSPSKLILIEKDEEMVEYLKEKFLPHYQGRQTEIEIKMIDFLKVENDFFPKKFIFISNIPYYISTPILEKLIENIENLEAAILTTQLEYYKRLAAPVNSKDYSSLSVFAQTFFTIQKGFKIKAGAFNPPPKVDSYSFLLLPKTINFSKKEFNFYNKLVRIAFQKRRKILFKTLLKGLGLKEELLKRAFQKLNLSEKARPQELSQEKFWELSKLLRKENQDI